MKYYAVKKGKNVGVVTSWEACEKLVKGFKGAVYKSFSKKEDAEAFIKANVSTIKSKKTVVEKKRLTKKQKDAKNEGRNLKKIEKEIKLNNSTSKKKKKVWTNKEVSNYYKESRELSDYSCPNNGIVESRYTKQ